MFGKLLTSLQRSTSSTKFIPEIDGMRFFAIITVVIFHLNTAYTKELGHTLTETFSILGDTTFTQIGWWIKRLDVGVKVFFAISGFILTIPFAKYYYGQGRKIEIKDYFIRRLTRLEPPYVVSLILFFFIHLFVLKADISSLLQSFFAGIFYLHTTLLGKPNPINPVTWSLETEAQFYIIVPIMLAGLFYFRNKKITSFLLGGLFILSVFLKNHFMDITNGHVFHSILVYLINFLVGIILAFGFIINKGFFEKKNYLWDIINVCSIFLMFYFYKPQRDLFNIVMLNIGIFIFFISVFKSKIINWFYSRPWVYTIGGMCYSIYLLHYAFFHLTLKFTSKIVLFDSYFGNLIIQTLMNLPIVFIISSVFFLLIEKPCMNKDWFKNMVNFFKK